MELKDCLIFNLDNKDKIVIPRSAIKGLRTRTRKDYSSNSEREYTILLLDIQSAENLGLDVRFVTRSDKVHSLEIADDLLKVMGMLGASNATEVLFK